MAGKTDVRWSDEEWAALASAAAAIGSTPGRVVKDIVRNALAGRGGARRVGPAAPEERESGGGDTERSQPERAKSVRGRPASSCPVGSAGSSGPVPPAGVAAPVVAPPPAAGAPVLVPVLEAVAGALRARGMAPSQAVLLARRSIVGGQVVIDGEVCRDLAMLVDPGSMGVG